MTGSESVGVSTPDLDSIARRWSRDGGMGNERSDEDYTDAGCRILARAAFADVEVLVGEVRRLQTQLTELREQIANEIEADGREVVQFLAGDSAGLGLYRLIGAEDAYKDAIRIARGVAETPEENA